MQEIASKFNFIGQTNAAIAVSEPDVLSQKLGGKNQLDENGHNIQVLVF